MPRSFAIKDINDYQREEEEFNMRKAKQAQSMAISKAAHDDAMIASKFKRDNPGGGVDAPSSVREAKHLEGLLKNKEYEKANRFMALKRSQAYGIDSFGSPVMQVPDESAPEFIPEGQPIDAQPEIPEYSTPFNPGPSISEQLARNAGLKSGAEERSKLQEQMALKGDIAKDVRQKEADVDLDMRGRIEADKTTAVSNAQFMAKGKQSLPKIQRTLQTQELKEEFLQPKIADLRGRALNIWSATGLTGSLLGAIPGTAAADFAKDVGTLLANAGFDRLQEMRDNSPTGGALGQVSERELDLLQAASQNLMNSQSEEQFIKNLDSFQSQRLRGLQNVRRAYEEDYNRFGGSSDAFLPSPASMEGGPSSQALAPFEQEQEQKGPTKYEQSEAAFKLRKQKFTDEQISEYLSAKGGQ